MPAAFEWSQWQYQKPNGGNNIGNENPQCDRGNVALVEDHQVIKHFRQTDLKGTKAQG